MAAKLLLCVSSDQATAAVWRRQRLESIRRFPAGEQGWNGFAGFLRSVKGLPISFLVDVLDEDYRFETLPRAGGGERAQMVARKLRQLYRSTAFSAASLQERSTGKRGDDRYLFAALTNPEIVSPWLRIVQQNGVPVAGVHLLPMVALGLVDRLKLKQADVLLVTKGSAGLRQTFCKHSRFRVSRLTPLRGGSTPAVDFYAQEIANTRMYLDALTVTHVDNIVPVVILDPDGSLASLPDAIARERPNLRPEVLGPKKIESLLGIPPSELAESADALYLRLLAGAPRLTDLAPPMVEAGFRVYRVKQLVYASAAAIALGAIIWAGIEAYRTHRAEAQTLALLDQARRYDAMYREVTAQFPKAPASAAEMREAVEAAERLRQQLRTPEAMLAVIGQALEANPRIALNGLEWRFTADKLDSAPGPDLAGGGASAGKLRQIGILSGEVSDYDGNYRQAVARIRELVQTLAAHDQVAEVSVIELPLDISSESGLSGNTNVSSADRGAIFRLAVAFAPGA